ncbi:lysoplasmalogenase family protein [Scatolibacter rhodanostii]|uniref:lysoplasmalogenase family protein n=1 Tax=Scatolibacter rhodanostii TaxID=2014781 RepID=UPI0035218B2D
MGFHNPRSVKDSIWLIAALFFTLVADVFLLFKILKPNEVGHSIGVSFFCLAHLCHRKRIGKKIKKWWWLLIPYSALWVAVFSYPDLPIGNIMLISMTVLYGFLLFLNLMSSFHVDWQKYNQRYLTVGMVFLVICDVCVISYQVLLRLPNVLSPAWIIYLSWVFYLPSQYFLVVSSWNKEKINKM